jgi:hypothetical protein
MSFIGPTTAILMRFAVGGGGVGAPQPGRTIPSTRRVAIIRKIILFNSNLLVNSCGYSDFIGANLRFWKRPVDYRLPPATLVFILYPDRPPPFVLLVSLFFAAH